MHAVAGALALLGLAPTSFAATPSEDDLATATPVPRTPFEGMRRTTGRLSRGSWYAYTPERDETVELSTAGSDVDTVLSVWLQDGTGTVLLARTTGVADGPCALLRARLPAGVPCWVHVAGHRGATGGGRLVVRIAPVLPSRSGVHAQITDVTVARDGTVTVSGTVRCDASGWADVYPQVTQSVGSLVAHADGGVAVDCAPTPTAWSVSLRSSTWVGFGAGRMTVSALVWAQDQDGAFSEVPSAWYRVRPPR